MATATDQATATNSREPTGVHWPAAFIGALLARSIGLAGGVAVAILLAAELFATR